MFGKLMLFLFVVVTISSCGDSPSGSGGGGPASVQSNPIVQMETRFIQGEISEINNDLNSDPQYQFSKKELDSLKAEGVIGEEDYQRLLSFI